MIAHIGELAAFGTAVSWTVGALVMEKSVRRVGVMAVNTLKVAFGSVYLALLAFFLHGRFFPADLSSSALYFLGLSGLIGFVFADYFLFHAYALIGSRLALLLSSISVPLTTIAAALIWGEAPGPWALAGMAVCIGGIVLTVLSGGKTTVAEKRYSKGVVYSLISAVGTSASVLLTKVGASGVDSVSATQIRIASALAGFILFALATRKTKEIAAVLFHPKNGLGLIAVGGVFGPFIGVGLLLFAIQHANAGVVSTLSALPPVLIIPPSILLLHRRVSVPEIIGACLAMCGLALMFV